MRMNRRKFLRFGGLISASPVVVGVGGLADNGERVEDLPRFETGQLLTVESLNALVDKVNKLERNKGDR